MTKNKKFKIVWSDTSKKDLKKIYTFIKKESVQGAKNVISDIRKAPKKIQFPEQTQVEEYYPECRRILVRNYKVLYQINQEQNILNVVRVFDTRQNPNKLKIGDF
jgi:addiction module RelE/StbE family toxin